MRARSSGPDRLPLAAVLLAALALATTLAFIDPRAFWVIDNANKFLQMQAIVASGYRDFSIPWPGRDLDPGYRWNPIPAPFGVIEDGRLYSFYPPAFALLASLPYRLLGMRGLLALPLLSAVALFAAVARTSRTLGADPHGQATAVLLTGLCTPVWFYSVVFWEHVPAACLALFGVEGVLRFLRDGRCRDLARGCALAAFAVYLRDELYLLCGVLAAVATLRGPRPRARTVAIALATLAASILPLWTLQAWALGDPLGFHAGGQWPPGLATHLRDRPAVAYLLFLAGFPDRTASLIAFGPLVLWLVLAPRLSQRSAAWLPGILAGFATLACGASLAGYARGASPIMWMRATNSLLPAAPVLVLAGFGFADPRASSLDPRLAGALRAIALGHAGLYALLAPLEATGGIHWGNRFLLVLYPLLAILAGPNLARSIRPSSPARPAAVAAIFASAALSLAAQLVPLRLLDEKLAFSVRLAEAARRHPRTPVATGLFWLPQELFAEFFERPIFLVASPEDLGDLQARLRAAGHRELLFATAPGTATSGTIVERVEDPALGFYGVDFVRVELSR
jgi:hypothetical protein